MNTKLKRLLSVFLCVAMLTGVMSSTALAAKTSGKCGKNLKWSYSKSKKVLTISGKGAMYNYSGETPWGEEYEGENITLKIEKGVTTIGTNAFCDMDIKKISLPSTLQSIGKSAFGGMGGSLKCSVTIPKSVAKIGKWAFVCEGIKSFKVEKGNNHYSSVDGVLFDKSKTTLIACPSGKKGSFTIPKGTKTIGEYAFNVSHLKKLVVPASVNKIRDSAFMWSNLKAVYFKGSAPKGLVFDSEDYIGTVYYLKSKESSWKKVKEKSKNWDFYGNWKTWNP